NWENKSLVNELIQATNFWLELGVSGFRIDAITFIKKDNYMSIDADQKDGLADIGKATLDRPGIHDFLQKLKAKSYGQGNYMTVAEAPGVQLGDLEPYIGNKGDFSMIFEFSPMEISLNSDGAWYPKQPWDNNKHRNQLYKSQLAIQEVGWMALFLENHDMPRCIDRCFGIQDDGYQKGSLLAMMYFFMRGTPFIYQGQEIGMRNHRFQSIDEFNDISTLDQYQRAISLGASKVEALQIANEKSRDHARTMIPWEEVKLQEEDPNSLLNFYKSLIRIRKHNPDALVYGSFRPIFDYYDLLFAYERIGKREVYTILANFSDQNLEIPWHSEDEIILSNIGKKSITNANLKLNPYEGLLLKRQLQ
ncbi:MAG: glucohydrolase, partial [Vallitaleaceae bacterium]|nr:glucohydrolase [Vallitaleaceae bacterium]